MIRTISELKQLSNREQTLLAGLARITALIHKGGESATDTVARVYPDMSSDTKRKVTLVLHPLID